MMKKFLYRRYALFGIGVLILTGLAVIIYLLSTDDYTDTKFRTMQDAITTSEKVDLRGLRDLQASGGPIVDFPELKEWADRHKKQIVIIDSMKECNGYVHDISTTFLGYHSRKPELRYIIRRLFCTGTPGMLVEQITPESEMALRYGFGYKNIQVDSRIRTPEANVEEFITYFDQAPKDVWFHFHCRHGKGRTSMALVMLDIMKNAPQVALKDIVKRQHLLGSVDLFDTALWDKGTYSENALLRRATFIQDFYAFICQRKAGGIQRWPEWLKKGRT